MTTSDYQNSSELALDSAGTSYLAEMAKWARFLAIVGFVLIGFIVLGALAAMTIGAQMFEQASEMSLSGISGTAMGMMIGIIYLVVAALYLFPTLKLFRFANHARAALAGNNSQQFTESIRNLKSFFKFFGVLTAVILGLYALIFLLMLIGGIGGLMR